MSWLLGAIMGGAASSAWEFGDEVESKLQRREWWWKQFKAKRRADEGAAMGHVSAFRAAVTEDVGEKATLAKHALAKTKMLRHPNILSCADVVESEKDIVIITEAVVALPDWLQQQRAAGTSQEQLDAVVVWGVRCILDALCFLHSQGLVHGLLCPESIFVTKAGDFKLWGLDLASNLTLAADQAYFRQHERCLATLSGGPQFRSPERSEGEWEKHDKHFGAADGWALGHTIPSMFIDEPTAELGKVCKRLSVSNPLARPKLGRVLEADCFTGHPYTVAMLFVAELSLKDHSELVVFFKALVPALPTMPTATRVYKLLPALHSGITRSLAPDKRPEQCREMVAACLPILGDIGSSMSGEEYREHVLPAVLPLFGVKDRAVRMLLLDRVEALVKHMDAQTVNGLVFEQLNAGFSDTAKELRELTLKSMLSLVEKLNDVNLNDKLMRTLAKLQQDPEASIRTNTTIFYGKVAPRLQESIRVRVIVPAFLKAMKDPFAYARLAAVRATSACREYYEPSLLVGKLLPELCPLLLDPYGPVRDASSSCMQQLLEPVKKQSDLMKADEAAKKEKHEAEEAARRAKEGPKVGELAFKSDSSTSGGPSTAFSSSSLTSLPSFSAAAADLTSGLSPAKPPATNTKLGAVAANNVRMATKLLPDPPSSGLSSKTSSDSAFWDAIGDDDDGLTQTTSNPDPSALSGWGDSWGDDDGLDALDALDDDDDEADAKPPTPQFTTEPLAAKKPTGAMKLGSSAAAEPLFTSSPAKKSVAERRAEAQKAKEARLMAASKLPTSSSGGDEGWEW